MSQSGGLLTIGAIVAALFLASNCGGDDGGSDVAEVQRPARLSADSEDNAADAAADAVSGTTYADQGEPYGCTDDCSGHEAGYAWAEENDVTDASDCSGNSQSFIEGCAAFAEAYQAAREEALDGELED